MLKDAISNARKRSPPLPGGLPTISALRPTSSLFSFRAQMRESVEGKISDNSENSVIALGMIGPGRVVAPTRPADIHAATERGSPPISKS